jgi:hypothetical protein
MNRSSKSASVWAAALAIFILVLADFLLPALHAQGNEMQQHLAEMKQSLEFNKQVLAGYTWLEQQIISVKGEQKKEELFNVRLGPDGKAQKTPLDPSSVSDNERKDRGLRGRIRERKIDEYQEYGDSIKTLVQQYIPPDKDMLEQSYQQGNVMIGPVAGQPNEYRFVITGYIKQGDKMTVVLDKSSMSLVSLSLSTYLADPTDAVNVNVQFTREPNGGPFHVATETIDGVSKQLKIEVLNSNYHHL